MAGLDDIYKSIQGSQNIHKSLIFDSPMYKILKSQKNIINRLVGAIAMTDISKNLQHQKLFGNSYLSNIHAMNKFLNLQSKFVISQTAFERITSMNQQNAHLFGNLRDKIGIVPKNQSLFFQINNWELAINKIAGQLTKIAVSQQNWDLINDFEKIAEEAVSLNESVFDDNGITKNGLDELKEFFQRIEIKVDKIDADANAIFWKLIVLLGFMLAVFSETRNWLPKPEYANKLEVETLIKEQFIIFEKKLKEDKEYRITSKVSKVMLKPRLKSLLIEMLPVNFEVTILQVNHKWIYVSYFSPKDHLPQTGWIMKKYLNSPK